MNIQGDTEINRNHVKLKCLAINIVHPFTLPGRNLAKNQVEELLLRGYSFVRWGDGEASILEGKSISYQCYSEELAFELKSVLFQPRKQLIVGAPYIFTCKSLLSLILEKKFVIWAESRALFISQYQNTGRVYADAFGFRSESDFSYLGVLKRLISASTSIYVIARESDNVDSFFSAIGAGRQVNRIVVPSDSCYSVIGEMERQVNARGKGDLILLSCGPASKALVARCLGAGAQLVDVGHLFDHFAERLVKK